MVFTVQSENIRHLSKNASWSW